MASAGEGKARVEGALGRAGGPPRPPAGVPCGSMLELLATGGPKEAFAASSTAGLVPADEVLAVNWQLDVPLRQARAWGVAALASEGLRADVVTSSGAIFAALFEPNAAQIGADVLADHALRGWGALLESGRIGAVTLVGNRPLAPSVQASIDAINRRLDRAAVPRARRIAFHSRGSPRSFHGVDRAPEPSRRLGPEASLERDRTSLAVPALEGSGRGPVAGLETA